MTIYQLWQVMETKKDDAFCLHIFDKTGNVNLGAFYKDNETRIPDYFKYIEIENISIGYDTIYTKVKDFRGDLKTKSGARVTVFGFDFDNGGDYFNDYKPAFINISDGEKISKIKLKPCDGYGYTFYYKRQKYDLSDVIRY